MESSIAGLLILSVLIVAVVLMSQAYVASNTLLGVAMVESVNLAEREGQDRFVHRVFSTSSTSTNNTLTIKVRNSGSTPIADYDNMDVFVDDERLLRHVYGRLYSEEGQWIVRGTRTWNPGETIDIEVHAPEKVGPKTLVVVSSPGVTEVGSIPTPTPFPTPTPTLPTPIKSYYPAITLQITTSTTSITVTCTP